VREWPDPNGKRKIRTTTLMERNVMVTDQIARDPVTGNSMV
jgi:hypothetical protein